MNDLMQFVEVPFYFNFHNKKVCKLSLISFGSWKYDWVINKIEM